MMHYYNSRSPTLTSPPEPFATMPLVTPSIGCHSPEPNAKVDLAGQVTMQGVTLAILHLKGSWTRENDQLILYVPTRKE